MKKCFFPIDALVVWCPTWSKNLERSLIYLFVKIMFKVFELRKELRAHVICALKLKDNFAKKTVQFFSIFPAFLSWKPVVPRKLKWKLQSKFQAIEKFCCFAFEYNMYHKQDCQSWGSRGALCVKMGFYVDIS